MKLLAVVKNPLSITRYLSGGGKRPSASSDCRAIAARPLLQGLIGF